MSTLPPKSDDFFPKVMKKHISVMCASIGKKSTACFPDEYPAKQKKGSGQKPEPLIILVRPARFERAPLGLEVLNRKYHHFQYVRRAHKLSIFEIQCFHFFHLRL